MAPPACSTSERGGAPSLPSRGSPAVRLDASGNLILVTPTAYARDWVRKNALRRMNELWLGLDGLSRRLEISGRVPVVYRTERTQVTPVASEAPSGSCTAAIR